MSEEIQVNPVLTQQLADSVEGDRIEAVFRLRSPDPSQPVPSPEVTSTLVGALLERATARSGTRPDRSQVFRTLGSFVVVASPSFVRELLRQPQEARPKLTALILAVRRHALDEAATLVEEKANAARERSQELKGRGDPAWENWEHDMVLLDDAADGIRDLPVSIHGPAPEVKS